jgi:L-ascorbate metabolism protein UlaG (beta-lactamase superfamily)
VPWSGRPRRGAIAGRGGRQDGERVPSRITWLGQAGFRLDLDAVQVLIDPFLSDYEARLYPPPDAEAAATGVDWLLVTHEHLDHLDEGFVAKLATLSPRARVVLPRPLVETVARLAPGLEVIGVQPGEHIRLDDDIELDVLPAWHAVEIDDGYSTGDRDGLGARFVGYIVRTPQSSVYHAGDTIVTTELREALADAGVDVGLLPINGRDHFREAQGLVGNMDAREAVRLAQEAGIRVLVPMHWDLFRGNTVNPGTAVDEAAAESGLHVLTLARFQPFPLPVFDQP